MDEYSVIGAPEDQAIREFLGVHGIEATEDIVAHLQVFIQALRIRQSRKIYGAAWRRYGALSNLLSVARKVDRLMQVFWHGDGVINHKDALDDAYDLINYAAFFIQNKEARNERGEPGN